MPTTKLGKFTIAFHNQPEFHLLKREIFGEEGYFFESDQKAPVIFDIGAHIGLSTLYFKSRYPAAQITAVEPLPQNRELLAQNVWENNLSDVTIIPAAIAVHRGSLPLWFDQTSERWWSTASVLPGGWTKTQSTTSVEVPARTLTELLASTPSIDLLKLDIEGVEQEVLEASQEVLPRIKNMIIEFHPTPTQSREKLLTFLQQAGFSISQRNQGQGLWLLSASRL